MARVRIISGTYGYRPPSSKHPVPKRIGDTVTVSDDEAVRLITLKVAELVDAQSPVSPLSVLSDGFGENSESADTDADQIPPESDEAADTADVIIGHLDAEQLMELTKAELLKLADEMGVDVSSSDNKAEIVAALTQVEVSTSDMVPPELSAEAPVV